MIARLIGLGLPPGIAKLVPWLIGALALLAALWWLRADAYRDGVKAERGVWEQKVADLELKALRIQRQAEELRMKAEQVARARIAQNRTEVDNATSNIPDQSTSARQRTRACIELSRQGKSPPACEPQSAAKPTTAGR